MGKYIFQVEKELEGGVSFSSVAATIGSRRPKEHLFCFSEARLVRGLTFLEPLGSQAVLGEKLCVHLVLVKAEKVLVRLIADAESTGFLPWRNSTV